MADGAEVAKAYVTIIPAFERGIQKDITSEVAGAAEPAGTKAGDTLGAAMGASMGRGLRRAMAGLGGLLAGGALFKGLFDIGAQFDEMTDNIIVGTGASGEALGELRDIAIDVGRQVPISFAQAGDYVQDLNTRLGLTGDNLEAVAVQLGQLSSMGIDVNVESFSGAMAIWNVEADDMAGKMDYLFAVSQSTGMSIDDLTRIAESNASQMQTLGYSFEDTVAMAGALDKAGLDASKDMSLLGRALVTLAKDGESPAETLERNVDEIGNLLEAGDRAAALDLASQLFGTKGANEFIAAIESGAMNVDEFVASLEDSGGIIDDTYEATASFAQSFQTFKNNLMALLEPIATPLFDAISGAMQSISDWMTEHSPEIQPILEDIGSIFSGVGTDIASSIGDKIIPALEKFRDFLTWCKDHGDAVKAILVGIAGAFILIKGASTFGPALSAISAGFGKLAGSIPPLGKSAGASAGQILALGAAVLMVGGGIALAAFGFQMLADAAVQLSEAGGTAIAIFAVMAAGIIAVGAAVLIAAPMITVGAPALLALGAALLMVGAAVAVAAVGIAYLVETVAANVPQLTELMQGAADAFSTAVQSIADGVSQVVSTISDGATQIIDAVSNLVDTVGGAISGVLDSLAGVFDSIGNAALNAGTGVSQIVAALIRLTDTNLLDLSASCEEAARGIKNMAQAAGDGSGLNAVAQAVQSLGTFGMVAGGGLQLVAMGMMMVSTFAAQAVAGFQMFASAVQGSVGYLTQAGTAVRTFAASQVLIALFSRSAITAFQTFGLSAVNSSRQAVTAVRSAMSQISSAVSCTRLQMQPINVGRLPHFRFEGTFNAQTGQTPALRVDWYAKGGVFGQPQIIGVGDARNQREIVTPENLMADIVDDSLESGIGGLREEIAALRSDVRNVKLYLDGDRVVGGIVDRMDRSLGTRRVMAQRGF